MLSIDHQFPIGRYYEDMFWTVQVVYKLNGLITVPNTFYHYRKNEGSIVTQKSEKHKEDALFAEEKIFSFMKTHSLPITKLYKLGHKDRIKILGLNIMKAEYYYPSTVKYKLFGFINVIEVEK